MAVQDEVQSNCNVTNLAVATLYHMASLGTHVWSMVCRPFWGSAAPGAEGLCGAGC